jgi:ribosomal protein S4
MLLKVFGKTQRYRTKIKKNSMIKQHPVVTDTKPHAWIVNPTDRGRKSIKNGNRVYLEDGQNFEIELFNPLQKSVLADIRVNGNPVSKPGLILRPGQRFYLDCFVEDRKKFQFNTYEVENTPESKEAISKNGTVEVFFFPEETNFLKINYPKYNSGSFGNPWYQPYNRIDYNGQIVGTTFTMDSTFDMNTSVNCFYSSSNTLSEGSTAKNIETGRVEKGEDSEQVFESVNMDFQYTQISSVSYQIFPESQRPVETSEIKKKFCGECGTKFKGSEKFCPECGTKI